MSYRSAIALGFFLLLEGLAALGLLFMSVHGPSSAAVSAPIAGQVPSPAPKPGGLFSSTSSSESAIREQAENEALRRLEHASAIRPSNGTAQEGSAAAAAQPRIAPFRPRVRWPIARGFVTISIIATISGAARTPLITALQ